MLELDWSKWDKASGKDNQPINPSAVGKKDDANPNFQFSEHFPNSLNVSFQASVINSEATVRKGVARCYSFLERAIEIGEKLEILNPETVILLKSLSVLAGSYSKFFERLPESIVGAIAYIKNAA